MISFYRGDLHKVSGIPRQWPLPKPTISLPAFKHALEKRHAALRNSPHSVSLPSSCLTRQDTCISRSRNASPSYPLMAAKPEDVEGDGGEGRGESGGKFKEPDYMDDDRHEETDDIGDGSKQGRDAHHGSSGSNGEERVGDASVPFEDTSAPLTLRGNSSDDPDHRREVKLDGAEEVEQVDEDNAGNKGRKKRRREEESAGEARKIIVKEEVVVENASAGADPMIVDEEEQVEDMELDQRQVDRTANDPETKTAGDIDEAEHAGREGREEENEAACVGTLGLGDEVDLTKGDEPEEEVEAAHVEAPSTPPVHSEDQNTGKLAEDNNQTDKEAGTTVDIVVDKKATKAELQAKLKTLTAEKHRLVQMLKQVLSSEEESKKKGQGMLQSPSAPGAPPVHQGGASGSDVSVAPVVQPDTTASANGGETQASADLEEGELEYARTPSPPPHTPAPPHSLGHGGHPPHTPSPSLGPLLGRQPQHMNQGGTARGGYYAQGLGIPPSSPAAAAAVGAGALSPGTGFIGSMPIPLGGRPYQHMAMHAAAALHAQKAAAAAAAAAAGHSHMSPILSGGGPAGPGNGVSNVPPGFGGYGGSPSVHPHHGHIPPGASPGAGHIAPQQGVVSSSLLTTPRGAAGYHDMRLGNPPWTLQR